MRGHSRVNARAEADWADHYATGRDGEPLNRCPCGAPIRTHVALCSEHAALVARFWRELAQDAAAFKRERALAGAG